MKTKMSRTKKRIVVFLIILELTTIVLMVKSYNNKPVEVILDDVHYKKLEKKEIKYQILLQSGDDYIESNGLPKSGYIYDEEKSGCIDENGEKIYANGENILAYNSSLNKIELLTDNTELCYLYFNEEN